MDRTLLLGTDWLTRGKFAFVNCTRDLLVRELVTLLPRDRTVLEILETVEPDRELVLACEKLKRAGYILALDDYAGDERWEPLLHIADIIKVDVKLSDLAQRYASARRFKSRGISLLAEKVETNEEFEWARKRVPVLPGIFLLSPHHGLILRRCGGGDQLPSDTRSGSSTISRSAKDRGNHQTRSLTLLSIASLPEFGGIRRLPYPFRPACPALAGRVGVAEVDIGGSGSDPGQQKTT